MINFYPYSLPVSHVLSSMSIFMDNWNLFWEGLENGIKTKESTPPPSPHSPPHVKILQDPVEIGVVDDYPEGDATSRTF